jgi:hypothetical protein
MVAESHIGRETEILRSLSFSLTSKDLLYQITAQQSTFHLQTWETRHCLSPPFWINRTTVTGLCLTNWLEWFRMVSGEQWKVMDGKR